MFKIVYVTVGADKIEYINMQRIAVASAKKHMPHVPVVIVTDGETLPKLRKYKDFSGVELASFPVPADLNTVEKSRYLKTNLRSLVSGDFLYIDSDSIICEDFSDDLPECSLGLVLDENRPLAEQDDGGAAIRRCAQARGFDLSGCESYFNGGVIFAKDDAPAKAFFKDSYDTVFPKQDGIYTWRVSIQEGTIYFCDEANTVLFSFFTKGTPSDLIPHAEWEIKLLEALPGIEKRAKQYGMSFIAEKRVNGGDYAQWADSNGRIDLTDADKYKGVLEQAHSNLGMLELLDAFKDLGDIVNK